MDPIHPRQNGWGAILPYTSKRSPGAGASAVLSCTDQPLAGPCTVQALDPKYPAGFAGTLAFGKSQAQVRGQAQIRHLPQSWGIVDRIWSNFFFGRLAASANQIRKARLNLQEPLKF